VIRAGDEVSNLVGVLDYGKINSGGPCYDPTTFNRDYRLHPTQDPVFTPANPRTAEPDDVGGEFKVASFNVLNYFTTLDLGADICGPDGDQECRGADSASEFTRQRDKIVAAMCAIDADIFGLMELENQNPYNDPEPDDSIDNYVLKDLVGALNDAGSPCPDKTYAFTDSPAVGTDAIRQGIIYKTSTVTPVGRAVLDDPGFTDPNNTGEQQSRPAIAETFEDANEARFTVVVNHLKSKGSACGPGDDDPVQGNCNDTRTKGAAYLIDWLKTDPTGSGDADFLVIGDLNAYGMEDPIMAILNEGYTDLLDAYQGESAYTYIFDGQSGYLDHALANPALVGEVTGATEWHINADEPPIIDYDEDYNPAGYYTADAYRASDHDPVIVGLDLCTDEIPPALDVTVSPDTLWPPNHKYVTVEPTITVSDNVDPDPTVTLVSVESNEADFGLDDEDLPNDIVIVDDYTFLLRAERWDEGDGRVYTITYQVADACGNTAMATVTVTVPHDRRP
jgi:predicted extracellular nuclease